MPHGCAGRPTRVLRVQVPEGLLDVKPMPKPGWTLATTRGAYAKPYDLPGKSVGEGVREVAWSGGELADAHYDEFVFRARVSGSLAGRAVPVPVVQECDGAAEAWVEVAGPGEDAGALKRPAPLLRVGASAGAGAAAPTSFRLGAIAVEQPWSRATPGGAKVAGGYMRITNTGAQPDRLVGGTFAAAGRFEVHETSVGGDNVMRMRPLDRGLEIAPGQTVELRPGGHHAMFVDLQRPLREGETLAGTLVFERAGTLEIAYAVRGIGARAPGAAPAADEHKHH